MRWIAGISLALLLLMAAAVLFIWFALPDLCDNQQLTVAVSPTGSYKAINFRRNCGATTPYSIQVSVIPAGMALPNEAGNLLVIRDRDLLPELRWVGPDALEILYPAIAPVNWVEQTPNEISVKYIPVSE